MKLEFFRRAVELVEKYRRPGQTVQHTFQTNGILIDDDWCAFFKEHNFLVGLSVDGPRELHDTYRVDRRGQGTFDLVMRGLAAYCASTAWNSTSSARSTPPTRNTAARSIAFSATSWARSGCSSSRSSSVQPRRRCKSPTRAGASGPAENACSIPKPATSSRSAPSAAEQYGRFLIDIFEEWVRHDIGTGLRPTVRRHAGGLFRPPFAVHPCPNLRLRSGAGVQRRSLFLRSFRRAALSARQYPPDAYAEDGVLARAAQIRPRQARYLDRPMPAAARSGRCATAAVRKIGSRFRATASRARIIFVRAWSCSSPTPGRRCGPWRNCCGGAARLPT